MTADGSATCKIAGGIDRRYSDRTRLYVQSSQNQHTLQKIYFNANCMILGPPPVAPRYRFWALVVILPNVAVWLRDWPGLLNLTELVTLNASARNSTRRPSPIENSLETASSHSQ